MGIDEEGGDAPPDRATSYTLTLEWRDGDRDVVRANVGESVLDAAERSGANLPFGCLIGACTTCTGRIHEGTVDHGRPPGGLKPRHLVDGFALLCIAEPRTDCRIEVGAHVQTTLVAGPLK